MWTIQQFQKEYDRLREKIEEADRLRPRFEQLQQFLAQAEHLSNSEAGTGERPEMGTAKADPKPPVSKELSITEAAAIALRDHPKGLHLTQLFEAMKAKGWHGSGNEEKDRESIRKSLRRKSKHFRNKGGNFWILIGEH